MFLAVISVQQTEVSTLFHYTSPCGECIFRAILTHPALVYRHVESHFHLPQKSASSYHEDAPSMPTLSKKSP